MDVHQAFETLGVPVGSDLGTCRAAYIERTRQLDSGAVDAMADLELAWEIVKVQEAPSAEPPAVTGGADHEKPSARQPRVPAREPNLNECFMCGSTPAKRITVRQVSGRLIGWNQSTLSKAACRDCADTAFRAAQIHNLKFGWWGIFAYWWNWVILGTNLLAKLAHRLPPADGRLAEVDSPFRSPIQSRPLAKGPGVYLGLLLGIGLFAGLVGLGAFEDPDTGYDDPAYSDSDTYDDYSDSTDYSSDSAIGTCLDGNGVTVDCIDSSAEYQITTDTDDPDNCVGTSFSDQDDNYYCATTDIDPELEP